ncbi:hypothetical protein OAO18_00580 [Francisellaceae bacterium]|nr:hypothetical protein [Francisellaceae bacterium]
MKNIKLKIIKNIILITGSSLIFVMSVATLNNDIKHHTSGTEMMKMTQYNPMSTMATKF